jgi:hypothetical protein
MVPQVPQQQQQPIAPYQALLAAGGVARPPFVASRSAGKLSTEDYYQQVLLSRMERQETEEQERERSRIEREERLAKLELQRLERERRLEDERRERDRDRERDEERKERAEERKAQRDMMNMFMMAFVGRSMSSDDSPAKKKRETKSDDSDSN